ncbi:Na+/H+ antiporter subunit E [Halococcus hamelinensis]|nr:Na+/H+ antiporter subunit E [Halococcus hamelinensis]
MNKPSESTSGLVTRFGGTGIIAFIFYLTLGDPSDIFDIVTGLVSAAVVAAVLGDIVFERAPTVETVTASMRALVFVPVLLVAVIRANLSLAAVVLHPSLPIDPFVVRVPAPEGRFARALLANSITLTPGTVTLDVLDDDLLVHALTEATRDELLEGALAQSVAFVTGDEVASIQRDGEHS